MLSMSEKDKSEERKKKIAFLQNLKLIRGIWFNLIVKYMQKIEILSANIFKWLADDERFYEKIAWIEKMKTLPNASLDKLDGRISDLFKMREQVITDEVRIERFKEKIKNLKSKSAKLKEFINEEYGKLHKERDTGLYDLINDMRDKKKR